jgi:hypothetical protein
VGEKAKPTTGAGGTLADRGYRQRRQSNGASGRESSVIRQGMRNGLQSSAGLCIQRSVTSWAILIIHRVLPHALGRDIG